MEISFLNTSEVNSIGGLYDFKAAYYSNEAAQANIIAYRLNSLAICRGETFKVETSFLNTNKVPNSNGGLYNFSAACYSNEVAE